MAVSVTNNLVTPTNADANATTGWTASNGPTAVTAIYREASGSLGMQAVNANEDEQAYLTIGSANFSAGVTLFGWMQNTVPTTEANLGMGILLGDATNERIYALGGSDNYGHFVNGWCGFRMDTLQLPATTRNSLGTVAPDLSAITKIGYGMRYAITAFGKVNNLFFDIIRYIANGSPALTIGGGTTGARGTFAEIAADDASTATGKAYGVIRTLTTGSKAFEVTYGIEFGAASGDTYFDDSNFQLVFAGTGMSAGNMDVSLLAGTGTNYFSLQDGVVVGIGTPSNWDLSAAFETLIVNRITFSALGTIAFPASGGTLRESKDCIFNNCGQVSLGNSFTFTGHTFNGTTDATGALLFDNTLDNANAADISFVSDGTGHGLLITAPGSYTLNNFKFSGYGGTPGSNGTPSSGSTDAAVYNNSGGAVTITVTGGGDSPSVRNGASATTTVIAGAVTVTVKAVTDSGSNLENAVVHLEAASGGSLPVAASVTIANSGTTATVTHTGHGLATNDKVVIRGASLTQNLGVYSITVTGTDTYTYTMGSAPGSSPTGTITSTFVVLNGLTNASGEISMSRVFGSAQPVTGRIRKASSAPYYKSAALLGTISSSTGATFTGVMLSDE